MTARAKTARRRRSIGDLLAAHGPLLAKVADQSLRHGITADAPPDLVLADYPAPLRAPGASFVTLKRDGGLRGCVGMVTPVRPLVADVAANAYEAGFCDPRFDPVDSDEIPLLSIGLTLVGSLEAIAADSEAAVLAAIVPGHHGLVLEDGDHRAVFLPSVWEQYPEPDMFVARLREKAGLADTVWAPTCLAWRFVTESAEFT